MKPEIPVISVILCTYNRARILTEVLESLREQSLEQTLYEIVVINNASTDHTADVVSKFQADHPSLNIVSIYEERQGLAHSRNTGLKRARGAYVAFLDDDCLAPTTWLKSLLECFRSVSPEPWSVGGPIVPIYDDPKPIWFKDEYEQWTWGQESRFLSPGESFFGGNMAFKKSLVEQYGGFDIRIGMRGLQVSTGEETSLYDRMWKAAGSSCLFYFCPQARITHRVTASRMTLSYPLKRAFAEGQVSYHLDQPHSAAERINGLGHAIVAWLWHGGKALTSTRPVPSWQNWIIEAGRIVAFHAGRVAAYLGLAIQINAPARNR